MGFDERRRDERAGVAQPRFYVAVFDVVLPQPERKRARAKRIVFFGRRIAVFAALNAVEIEDESRFVEFDAQRKEFSDGHVVGNALNRRVILSVRAEIDDLFRRIETDFVAVERVGSDRGTGYFKAQSGEAGRRGGEAQIELDRAARRRLPVGLGERHSRAGIPFSE